MGVSSLSCQITLLQAKNLEVKSHGGLFVRYYLSAGDKKKVKLNTQEISTKSNNLSWNESFSLECLGTEDSLNNLKQESVVFELRWRSATDSVLGIFGGSKLLGRAEVPWKSVLESPNMEMEKWVSMVPKRISLLDGVKPPSVQIGMRVGVPKVVEMEEGEKRRRRNSKLKRWDNCGCCDGSGCKCEDYDIFALAAALEAL